MENNDISQMELFDKYSSGELKGDLLANTEKKLQTDEVFLAEYTIYQEMIAAMHFGIEEEIRKDIIAAQEELEKEEKLEKKSITDKPKVIPIYRNIKIMSIAASIALVLGLFSISNIWFSNSNLLDSSTESLAPIDLNLRGTNNADSFEKGIKAFNNNNSKEATHFFENIAPLDENYMDARYFLAYVQYQNKAFQSAIDNAKIVSTSTTARLELKHQAEWLQIQTMLSAGQEDSSEFLQLLNTVTSNKNHLFFKKALPLQNDLNSFWRKLVL